jgi:1-acyl-sn-glycerol-3-phosphate acyltransferase
VPILPIGVGGSERAMPKGRKVPSPTKMTLVVGEPIHPPAPPDGKERVPRRAVHELTAELKTALQDLFDEAQEWAGCPNPPRSSPGGSTVG